MTIRAEDLRVGDKVRVTVEGKTYEMTVSMIYTDYSIGFPNSLSVMVRIRPGGYGLTLRNDTMTKYGVEKVE